MGCDRAPGRAVSLWLQMIPQRNRGLPTRPPRVVFPVGSRRSPRLAGFGGSGSAVTTSPGSAGLAPPGSGITSLAGFAGAARPHLPGGRSSMPASLKYVAAVSRRIPVAFSIRRNDHPRRPRAMTCCFFSSLKTLLTATEGNAPASQFNVLGDGLSLAGFG